MGSSTFTTPAPPNALDLYPERPEEPHERMGFGQKLREFVDRPPGSPLLQRKLEAATRKITARGRKFSTLSPGELDAAILEMKRDLRRRGLSGARGIRCFALVREICHRELGMRPYDVQIMAGWALLNGLLAEMQTGEGKTLSAVTPAASAALAGVPVHLFTVNDYLAQRDADFGRPVYEALGLTVGVIVEGMEPQDRRAAYRSDVVYGTYKQIVFDYLKDRLILCGPPSALRLRAGRLFSEAGDQGGLLMRGLHFGIIDEADSILIDEARTPLILSRKVRRRDEEEFVEDAMALAGSLQLGTDYKVHRLQRHIELTKAGRDKLAEEAATFGPLFSGAKRREEAVAQALFALNLLERGDHYLVRDGKIQMVDEFTGRTMPDRTWSQGLHQMVEFKENCEPSPQNETLAQITTQRFFRRYLHLSGMTGTANEVGRELWSVYRLATTTIPKRKRGKRVVQSPVIMVTKTDKWRRVAKRTAALTKRGQPVLIGIRTVAASEEVSRYLAEARVEHQILNADQDAKEAEIIARAGQPGQVTVATNMAGRGTDISLGDGVCEAGGLAVIVTELHDSKRIDRQLMGRCARQDDRGRVETILSLEDEIVSRSRWRYLLRGIGRVAPLSIRLIPGLQRFVFDRAQGEIENVHARMRKMCVVRDKQLARLLAFSGHME